MKTKLDHIYGASGGASNEQLESIENRLTTLSNSAAKINVAQSFTGLQTFNNGARSNVNPSNANDLVRKSYADALSNYSVLVNHTTALAANQEWVWTLPANTLRAQKINELVIVVPVANVDLMTDVKMYINNIQYNNMGPVIEFATGNAFDKNITCKFWVHENKFKFRCNVAVNGIRVWYRIRNL